MIYINSIESGKWRTKLNSIQSIMIQYKQRIIRVCTSNAYSYSKTIYRYIITTQKVFMMHFDVLLGFHGSNQREKKSFECENTKNFL